MYQGRTFIRESVYVCGNYMDADIYPVFQKPGRRRSRCKPTSAITTCACATPTPWKSCANGSSARCAHASSFA